MREFGESCIILQRIGAFRTIFDRFWQFVPGQIGLALLKLRDFGPFYAWAGPVGPVHF
jgi:hypothetical protein